MTRYEEFKEKFADSDKLGDSFVAEFDGIKVNVNKVKFRSRAIENIYHYEVTDEIFNEVLYSESTDYKRGKYAYMAMILDAGVRKCIGVAYNIDYCLKLADRFLGNHPEMAFTHINKVLWGELKEEKKIFVREL